MASIEVSNQFIQATGQEGTPVADIDAVKGGWLSVADTTARDAILSTMRSVGQVVLVRSSPVVLYRWDGSAWVELELGSAVAEVATFGDLPAVEEGAQVFVVDASGDSAVSSGGALYYGRTGGWVLATPVTAGAAAATAAIARQGVRRVTTPIFWRENKEVATTAKVMSASESVEGLVVLVKGSVFTTAGTFTLDVTRGDTDASLLTGGTAIDVTALTLGANAVTLAASVTPGEGVEIIVTVTSNNEDLAGGTLYLVTETELA